MKSEAESDLRILAAGALVLEFVLDVVTVAAADHGELGMNHCGLESIKLPKIPVAISYTINEPGGGVTHLMDQCVPETIYKDGNQISLAMWC